MAPQGDGNIADGFRTVQGHQPTFVPISFLGLEEDRHRLPAHLHPHDHSIVWCSRPVAVHLVAHRIISTPDDDRLRPPMHEPPGARLLPEPAPDHPERCTDRRRAREEARIKKPVIIDRHGRRIDVRGVAARVADDEESRARQRPRRTIKLHTKSRSAPRDDLPKDRPRVGELGDRAGSRACEIMHDLGIEPDAAHGQERLAVDQAQIHVANAPTAQSVDQGRQITAHAEVPREQVLRAEGQVAQGHSHAGGTHGGRANGPVPTHHDQRVATRQRLVEPLLARPGLGGQAANLEPRRFERALDAHAGSCGLPAT